ncbi:predicted protein [Nematostella vectensis]|uniref:Uncharacterized protein n=1 Tax=Nematostella vectensis TaxID=45351 RepID=A7SGC9_NEMVE|nr:uncharacterized protein LOC5508708 [Nematostella vectensis]EDO37247.1 predicted protein [Nematostella vectensis]|eukprot:XP_001629310.1 predicted protein [Nematostella vectensis]
MSATKLLGGAFASYFGAEAVPHLGSTIEAVTGLEIHVAKEFFASVNFKCPSVHYKAYGYMYLFIPAAVLFCLALWARKSSFLNILLPVSWLMYAFIDTTYYVCATLGPKDIAMAKANTTEAKEAVLQDFADAEAMSQMVAFILLLSYIVCATIAISVIRLCKKAQDPKELDENNLDDAKEEDLNEKKQLAAAWSGDVIGERKEETNAEIKTQM